MIDEKFVIVGALFNIMGSSTYAFNTMKGRTKPNKVSWFFVGIAPLIAFSAQINEGVGLRSLMTFMVGLGPLLIFASSFVNKKAYWKITKFDIACGALSLLALFLWLITGRGLVAILFSILADLFASIPTVVKSYSFPETEHPAAFRNGAISAFITLLTIDVWRPENYAFALYILLICATLYALIRFKLGQKLSA